MTKADIVELVSEKSGFPVSEVKVVVGQFLEEIKNCLAENKHLEIRGFGAFRVKRLNARKARNPKTGEEVLVPARKKAVFKVSRELSDL